MLVGRSSACALRLDERHVSGEHATLIWMGGGWEIRDLGSRNGTFVGGERLVPGEAKRLAAGVRIGFGDPEQPWELADAGAPGLIAEDADAGTVRSAHDGALLALPDDSAPEAVLFVDRAGRWVAEIDDQPARPVKDQEVMHVGGRSWRLHVPARIDGTATVDHGPTIDSVSLRFAVSRDEEHVVMTVVHRGREIALEPREHGYALLTLARQRLDDRDEPTSEQGWIERDQLLRMLGLDSNALNVAIYRARNQLGDAGIDGAAGIVEVRRGQRRIGLEPERLEVVPL